MATLAALRVAEIYGMVLLILDMVLVNSVSISHMYVKTVQVR